MMRYNLNIEVAVLISVLLHALGFGAYYERAFLQQLPLLHKLTEMRRPATPPPVPVPTITFIEEQTPAPTPPPVPARPKMYVPTTTQQTSTEPPPETQFYGERATVAANPENPSHKAGDTPFLPGTEARVLATETAPLASPGLAAPPPPPEPATEPAPASKPSQPVAKPQPEVPAEGLNKAPPPPDKQVAMLSEPPAALSKPFRAAEPPPTPSQPGQPGSDLATIKSRLTASGVDRRGIAAFNVAESPFGAYDREIIRAVQSRWFFLIQKWGFYERAGTVTLYFELYDDGKIGKLQRKENTAGEMAALICEKSVADAAPFDPLPDKLRLLVGRQPRDITFTFYY